MCGICGIIKFSDHDAEPEEIRKMMRVLKHRGPDDQGCFVEGRVALGFVRLSILDLSPLGHQPMFSGYLQQNELVIVYNGEVYNYIELRTELISKGYVFKSNTDTEVVLNSYIEWGEECLTKFNGMWAFAIYDRKKKTLFCSRDRFGVKPFYYYSDDDTFYFASEIPAILAVLKNKPKANLQVIYDFLVFNRTDQSNQTFFKEIKKLQHGNNINFYLGGSTAKDNYKIKKWYNLAEQVAKAEPVKNPGEYKELFSSAVGLRLRSDVPVGVCLSGGLDSSSIVSVLLKDYDKKDLKTFSAVYGEGKCGDESPFIEEYKLKNMFFTTPCMESLLEDLEKFVKAQGEPIPTTSPYAQFKVMELAREHVLVTLDGQGADEQLAGYHYFYGFYYKHLLKTLNLRRLLAEIYHYLKLHKSLYGIQTFIFFLLPSSFKSNARVTRNGYLNKGFIKDNCCNSKTVTNLYNSATLNDALLDHFEYKLEHLLKWEDRNSMYFSIESRIPFLDYRLVEKTLATTAEQKIKNGWTKHILREAMTGILPEKIRLRKDKVGFGTPDKDWFRTEKFQKYINDILNSESFKNRGIVDTDKVKKMYLQYLKKGNNVSEIWKCINLELWFRIFID